MIDDGATPTPRLRAAAAAERRRIEHQLSRIENTLRNLEREIVRLRTRHDELSDQLRVVNLLSREDSFDIVEQAPDIAPAVGPVLKGAQIREVAVRLLAGTPRATRPIHYRAWYELLTKRGLRVSGKAPQASFLTQISRSPVVVRTDRPGHYQLDWDYLARARLQLQELQEELADLLVAGRGSVSDERQTALNLEIRHVERSLAEALRSLGAPTSSRRVA